ncbi:MAG: hypothetical protein JST26_09180 [Bacteroidetes bacterium]|nr:hypothetical protein [Bacteroidota bacterium]
MKGNYNIYLFLLRYLSYYNRKLALGLVVLITLQTSYGQSYKYLDAGVGLPTSYNSRIPCFPTISPFISCGVKRHQFECGLDIYTYTIIRKIYGARLNYRYLLSDERKKFNVFGELNLQYSQYGSGLTLSVPYNYLPADWPRSQLNLIQTRSLISTLGIGVVRTYFKRISFLFVIGVGGNYYKSNFAPTNVTHDGIYRFDANETTKPIPYGRLSLSFRIFKNS